MEFGDFRVLTFDCYGTLVDWETGILTVLRPWIAHAGIAADDAQLLSAFGEAESAAEHARPGAIYPDILRDTHARMSARFGAKPDAKAAEAFANSVGDWPAFADTPDALKRLQRRHKLMIVSNVDRASFARTQPKLGVVFDAVVTAEEVGAYKPDLKMFYRALEISAGWGFSATQILHVGQSLFHDHAPAKKLGLKSAWVKRPSPRGELGATRDPGEAVKPDVVVSSLAKLAELIETEGVT
ncbi:MAG TPA: HAD family hydrolase [Candidatus Acidoferrales bacterium]|nr:HAD family hydrolase [Candidatus Acidoferrales bacterium]